MDYGAGPAVDGVDLAVAGGETLVLLGPSGSGKTTILHAIAGFVPLRAGRISIHGRPVASPTRADPPERRSVSVVFQDHALWPHLAAIDNVAYPLLRAGLSAAAARREAAELLELLAVGRLAERLPAELSGGERQRVGIARALARRASVQLLDEPTAHLDATLRAELRDELSRRRRGDAAAAVYATHDLEEAFTLADRVALLRAGRVVQIGSPVEVHDRPVDRWAARITGTATILSATFVEAGRVDLGGAAVAVTSRGGGGLVDRTVEIAVRPEWVQLMDGAGGRVREIRFRGSHTDYVVSTPIGDLEVRRPGTPAWPVGAAIAWRIDRAHVLAPSGRIAEPAARELQGAADDASAGGAVAPVTVGP